MIAAVALSAGITFLVTYPLIRLARSVGWVDAPGSSDSLRKLQRVPVPVVGGAAILLGLLLLGGGASLGAEVYVGQAPGLMFEGARAWPPLLAAFCLGLVDDLRPGGLRPALKVAGQVGVGLVVALSVFPGETSELLLCLVIVPLALNAWNTFDNADGAASGVGAIALLSVGSPAAGPLLGFLGWNLRPRVCAAAYLGDSGSHLVGCLILLHPGAWPLMALPLLDLIRVACARISEGRAPWQGDRTHLAHRLQRRGLSPLGVASSLWALAASPLLSPGWGDGVLDGLDVVGFALCGLGFLAALRLTRACSGTEVPR